MRGLGVEVVTVVSSERSVLLAAVILSKCLLLKGSPAQWSHLFVSSKLDQVTITLKNCYVNLHFYLSLSIAKRQWCNG